MEIGENGGWQNSEKTLKLIAIQNTEFTR